MNQLFHISQCPKASERWEEWGTRTGRNWTWITVPPIHGTLTKGGALRRRLQMRFHLCPSLPLSWSPPLKPFQSVSPYQSLWCLGKCTATCLHWLWGFLLLSVLQRWEWGRQGMCGPRWVLWEEVPSWAVPDFLPNLTEIKHISTSWGFSFLVKDLLAPSFHSILLYLIYQRNLYCCSHNFDLTS